VFLYMRPPKLMATGYPRKQQCDRLELGVFPCPAAIAVALQ